jgi:hypothetical protein
VLANLLECVLFHDYAAQALGDGVVDLVDYACRQVARLVYERDPGRLRAREERRARAAAAERTSPAAAKAAHEAYPPAQRRADDEADEDALAGFGGAGPLDSKAAAALLQRDEADPEAAARRQLRAWAARVAVHTGVTCVTLLRYLAEHCPRLPVSAMARLIDTHDAASLVVPLIENPPWVRKAPAAPPPPPPPAPASAPEGGSNAAAAAPAPPPAAAAAAPASVWQKYEDHRWVECAPRDLLRLSRLEAQPWLTLHALLLEPECRRRYAFEGHRRQQAMRVRK